jgi:hypothetical protein
MKMISRFLAMVAAISLLAAMLPDSTTAGSPPARRVYVRYWPSGTAYPSHAITWFGEVTPTSNYTDLRLIYTDDSLKIAFHVVDRRLFYDLQATEANLTNYDSVSLYLNLDGRQEIAPDSSAYRFVSQLNWWQPDSDYQAVYRGNGSSWSPAVLDFTALTERRGDAINDDVNDSGWTAYFTIPFSSLGLSGPPKPGTTWGLAAIVHDRDDLAGTFIPDQTWPEVLDPNSPASWGEMVFDMPVFAPGQGIDTGSTVIRHGLQDTTVVDAHVGGHGDCSAGLWPDIFTNFGIANYAGYTQINIQNQWDVADFACFSKFYVTFPLDLIPPGQVILSAKLTLHLFGNAGGGAWGEPPDSYIQALTVGEDWQEATINWNNAPLPVENISGTWVKPLQGELIWPGVPYEWDVSRAVAQAYAVQQSARLVLYSADGDYHTGKYFSSSDAGDWNAAARPTLVVIWGEPCDQVENNCNIQYLPLIRD